MSHDTTIDTTEYSAPTSFTIDGHRFEVNYDDAAKLHAFLEFRRRGGELMASVPDGVESDPDAVEALYSALSDVLRSAIESVLGDGAWATLFGDEKPVFRAMALVNALAENIGPAYDAMFKDYAAQKK